MLAGKRLEAFCVSLISEALPAGPDFAKPLAKAFAAKVRAIELKPSRVKLAPATSLVPPEKPFDPYAFSVVALMSKKGREALSIRLAAIGSNAHLVQLAEAQGLELDPAAVDATPETIDSLRDAILAAAERRIANRRAAAS